MNEGFHLSRHNYFCLFRQMIVAWRAAFMNPSLPFNFVQLHACDVGNSGQCFADFCNYGDIRMAQDDTARFLDGVGMAVSYDHGWCPTATASRCASPVGHVVWYVLDL